MLLAGCGGSTPPAEPVPAPTPVAAIDTPPPEYPFALACAGIGGQAVLRVEVGPAGTPTLIELVRGSGNDDLDRLAKDAVQGWKFRPATRAGAPVAQAIQVPVNFTPGRASGRLLRPRRRPRARVLTQKTTQGRAHACTNPPRPRSSSPSA